MIIEGSPQRYPLYVMLRIKKMLLVEFLDTKPLLLSQDLIDMTKYVLFVCVLTDSMFIL